MELSGVTRQEARVEDKGGGWRWRLGRNEAGLGMREERCRRAHVKLDMTGHEQVDVRRNEPL